MGIKEKKLFKMKSHQTVAVVAGLSGVVSSWALSRTLLLEELGQTVPDVLVQTGGGAAFVALTAGVITYKTRPIPVPGTTTRNEPDIEWT